MPMKQVVFGKDDKKLIEDITAYQKSYRLSTFPETVRKLCYNALLLDRIKTEEERLKKKSTHITK